MLVGFGIVEFIIDTCGDILEEFSSCICSFAKPGCTEEVVVMFSGFCTSAKVVVAFLFFSFFSPFSLLFDSTKTPITIRIKTISTPNIHM